MHKLLLGENGVLIREMSSFKGYPILQAVC